MSQQIPKLAKAIIKGSFKDTSSPLGSGGTLIKHLSSQGIGPATKTEAETVNVSNLTSNQKVIKVFQVLHPDKGKNPQQIITDEEFRQFRRAVGKTNYEKAMDLFYEWLTTKDEADHTKILTSAAIIGSIPGAKKAYDAFLQSLK